MSLAKSDAVAVVGMAARLPGVSDLDGFWRLMMSGEDTIGPVPASRWNVDEQLDEDQEVQAVGGFLEEVDQFDPTFFGISPREAADMDPQQRLMLEIGWRALEDAGQPVAALRGSNTGVYVGGGWNDYQGLRKELHAAPTAHSIVGSQLDGLSARLSFALGLTGPSIVVSTGCSGSLVALHLAVQALRAAEVDSAIVGGVNLILLPDSSVGLTHLGVLSPDGRCKAFGAGADGYVRGEGALAVYMKPLSRAIADGDHIHAVIAATAVNQDGGGDSFTTPYSAGQEDLLRRVYADSEIPREKLLYVEAHGTGTERGDPIEADALARVLGDRRDRGSDPLGIGSVKTNVGHLEAAAGLAGLVKVVLALEHGVIPPSLNADELNPEIPFERFKLELVREPRRLPPSADVFLAVNSFGWGGTNAHVVVTRPDRVADAARRCDRNGDQVLARDGLSLVPLSGHRPDALERRVADLRTFLAEHGNGAATLPEVAGTLAWHRDHYPYRTAFLAGDLDDLTEQLGGFLGEAQQSRSARAASPARPCGRVAFVFPGQGSQWATMGRDLYLESQTFAKVIDRCAGALAPHLGRDLTEIVSGAAGEDWLSRLDLVQPVLWAVSLGLAEAWRRAGVEPDVVVGHSQGEITAATCAGILSYDDAALLVARRSAIVQRTAGHGRMLAVDLEPERAQAALAGFERSVSVAAHNGPRSCVLSGETEAILVLQQLLEADGTYCRLVNVDYASHSPQMEALRGDLLQAAEGVKPQAGAIPLMSTVRVTEDAELDADYWVENLCQPVLLAEALEQLFDENVTHVVEISPHPVLAPAIEQLAAGRQDPPAVLVTLRRDAGSLPELQGAFAGAYESGLEPFGGLPKMTRAPLPRYPWQRTSCWIEPRRRRRAPGGGLRFELAPAITEPDTWEGSLDLLLDDHAWLADHRVGEAVVLPATAIMGICLGVAAERLGGTPGTLTEVAFRAHVTLNQEPTRLAAVWRDEYPDEGAFALSSLSPGSGTWSEHASARALREPTTIRAALDFPGQRLAGDAIEAEAFYAACAERGLNYGPAFRGVERVYSDGREALGAVSSRRKSSRYQPGGLHPALWDAALQVALTLCEPGATVVPVRIERLHLLTVSEAPVTELWAHAVRRDGETLDVVLFDRDRRPLIAIEDLRLERLASAEAAAPDPARVHRLRFRDEQPALPQAESGRWAVCGSVDGDDDAVGQLVEAVGEGRGHHLPAADRGADSAAAKALHSIGDLDGVAFVAPAAGAGLAAQERGLLTLAELVRACLDLPTLPRLAVITRGAQAVARDDQPDPGAALYSGFCRVLAREHPELSAVAIDGDASASDWPAAVAHELLSAADADQVVLRGDRRLVGEVLRGHGSETPTDLPPWRTPPQPFCMRAKSPGLWRSLEYCSAARRRPRQDEVEVEVGAASLNFIDVMKAMGTYPDESPDRSLLGGECAGRVVAVGPRVDDFAIGDRVVACAFGSLGSHVTAPAGQVQLTPEGLDDSAAAAMPLVFTTAWHALRDLARLGSGETVLIHSAAGGLGLAAIAVGRHLGATVLATAGTPEKRSYLRESGVEHVFDSRGRTWAAEVRDATSGRGVDVVLNSLAGAAIPLGLELVADFGHFIEVGKRDIYDERKVTLAAFMRSITLSAVDLAALMRQRPQRFAELFKTVWGLIAAGELGPLPVATRPFADGAAALREMSRGRHIGKLVLRDPTTVTGVSPEPMPDGRFRRDGTYLITGGLGALGLSLAEFMSARGAGSLALLARSAPSDAASRRIDRLRADGTDVVTFQTDLTDAGQVGDTVAEIRAQRPPLRGVLHLAGALDDATILNLQESQLERVIGPKLHGALHLDELTDTEPLDLFVLFSSAATLIGNPGQAVYAAANAALDALAQRRRMRGRPGLSVQWGPFEDVGLAAQDGRRGSRLAARGLDGFAVGEAWEALAHFLAGSDPVLAYMPLNLRQWFDAYPQAAAQRSWAQLAALASNGEGGSGSGSELLDLLRRSSEEERLGVVESQVRELAADVLRLDLEVIAADVPFKALGLDSLMGLELRNRLESTFGLRLSPTLLWTHGTAHALSVALCELLNGDSDAAAVDGADLSGEPVP